MEVPFFRITKWGKELSNEDFAEAYLTIFLIELRKIYETLRYNNYGGREHLKNSIVSNFRDAVMNSGLVDHVNCEIDETYYWNTLERRANPEDPLFMLISYTISGTRQEFGHQFKVSFDKSRRELNIERITR